jgi:hypothetical protein
MKLLISIVTCLRYRDRADVLRRTWVPEARKLGLDVYFFVGQGAALREDEIVLDIGDDYGNLRRKVQKMFAWAVEKGYDFVLKTDDDVILLPERLLASDFHKYDYEGHVRGPSGEVGFLVRDGERYASGWELYGSGEKDYASGFFYTLSQRAARIVANAPDNGDWAEDRFVGQALAAHGILPQPNEFYRFWPAPCRAKYVLGACPFCEWAYRNFICLCPHEQPDKVAALYDYYRRKGTLPTVHDEAQSSAFRVAPPLKH